MMGGMIILWFIVLLSVLLLFRVDHYMFFYSFYRVVQRLDLMKSKASVLSSVGYLCTSVLICFLF